MPETKIFTVPDLGEGLTDASLTEWYVTEGDLVTLNQPLCSLSTAKAEVDIPSPFAGRVSRRHGQPGDSIDVGLPLVEIEVDAPAPDSRRGPVGPAASDEGPGPILVGYGTSAGPARRDRNISPDRPPKLDGDVMQSLDQVGRSGTALAKPPVRALARRLGVNIEALTPGSGRNGIVTRQDVEAAGRASNGHPGEIDGSAPTGPGPVSSAASASTTPPTTSSGTDGVRIIPVRGVRALIGERMTLSRHTIPEAWCGLWVDATVLIERVHQLRSDADEHLAAALTPFSMMVRFVVAALQHHPLLNASFDAQDEAIRVYDAIHVGVAVAGERGLVVPVVRNAERLTTRALALETRRLIGAVRTGTAAPSELSGSTFTISNFGALGLDDGNPIINAPEAAILGIGAIKLRPAVANGEMVARSTAKLTCVIDHRVCDGAEAGGFLRDLARLIEDPDRALLDL